MTDEADDEALVGPVFVSNELSRIIVEAIVAMNARATVTDRGSYLRVSSPMRCELTRAAIESHLGRPVDLRAELEAIMTSFAGRLELSDDRVAWLAIDRAVGR